MDGKEAIVSDIVEKANQTAENVTAEARARRDETMDKLKAELARKREQALTNARKDADDIVARRRTLSNLEARKTELAAKQRVIDAAFDEAAKKMLNMTDHIYREFIANLMEKFGEDGDKVIVAERDVKRLHPEWLESVCKETGKNFTFSDETHAGKGGIILSGVKCDKNLMFETMLDAARETSLSGVVMRIFKNR